MFLIVYLSKDYWYVEVNEASTFLTLFNISFARFCFIRMSFGLTAVGDAFQCKLDSIYSNLNFVTGISDDMVIWDEQADGSDHDQHLSEFLHLTWQHNLKLVYDKVQYKAQEVCLFGSIFTAIGHKPEDWKVESINKMPLPTNVRNLQCFLGMVNYLNKYSVSLTTACMSSLRRMLFYGNLSILKPSEPSNKKSWVHLLSSVPQLSHLSSKQKPLLKGLEAAFLQDGLPIYLQVKAYNSIRSFALPLHWRKLQLLGL